MSDLRERRRQQLTAINARNGSAHISAPGISPSNQMKNGSGAYSGYYGTTSPQNSASSGVCYELLGVGYGGGNSSTSRTYHNQLLSGDETKNRHRKNPIFARLRKINILVVLSITTLGFFASTLHYRSRYISQTGLEAKLHSSEKHVTFLRERIVAVENEKRQQRKDLVQAKKEGRRLQDALQKAEKDKPKATNVEQDKPKAKLEAASKAKVNEETHTEHAPEIEADEKHHPYWDGLSEYSKMAATVLGYDQHSWDSEDYVHLPIFEKTLHELSEEARSASSLLWLDDYFKQDEEKKNLPKVGDEIEKDPLHHPYWDGLSEYSRMAAAVIGYDKDSWDNIDTFTTLPIFEKTLDELSDEEREASRFLWLEKFFKTKEGTAHTEHAPEIEADKKHHPYWDGLSEYSKMAAAVLGYDQHSWDDEEDVLPIFEKTLHELTEEERSASSLLWLDDYFKQDENNKHLPKVGDEIEKDPFHHPYWDELSEYSRMAATVIGYDKKSWDSSNTTLPIFDKTVDELTDEEREASKFLWLDEFFQSKEGVVVHSH